MLRVTFLSNSIEITPTNQYGQYSVKGKKETHLFSDIGLGEVIDLFSIFDIYTYLCGFKSF